MICLECKEQGLKSKVYNLGEESTTVGYLPFRDEDGNQHHHDGNRITVQYRCSKGHNWTGEKYNTCWCGWTSAPEQEERE
jgi:hypothetical protein